MITTDVGVTDILDEADKVDRGVGELINDGVETTVPKSGDDAISNDGVECGSNVDIETALVDDRTLPPHAKGF